MRFGKSLINFSSVKHTALGKVQPVFVLHGFRQLQKTPEILGFRVFSFGAKRKHPSGANVP